MTISRSEDERLRHRDRQVIRTDDLDDESRNAVLCAEASTRLKAAGKRLSDVGPDDVTTLAVTNEDDAPASEWIDPDDAPELTDAWFDAAEFRVNGKVIRPARGYLAKDGVRLGRPPARPNAA
jgi:hypothetical protein